MDFLHQQSVFHKNFGPEVLNLPIFTRPVQVKGKSLQLDSCKAFNTLVRALGGIALTFRRAMR